ncbi:hypothetical protein [Streptomyces sp. TLI_171]|uniref:hypothetical protein n=1 Tax=Streptomyces sp. TLI_171 TaxID=1938859 RepID=UPI000C1A5945|nr:hypothetical protein [Streptomyces sp. TLI_171]
MRKQDLQDGLARRYNSISTARRQNCGKQLQYAADWIRKQPELMGFLQEARRREEPPEREQWLDECESELGIVWPTDTEEGQAALAWDLLDNLDPDRVEHLAVDIFVRAGVNNIDHMVGRFATEVFTPLFQWLSEQVQRTSSVVHTLRRYVYETETFSRDALYAEYLTRTSTGEELYNDNLQLHLFRDGEYVTYAKVRSASGEPDLVGDLDTWDPIVLDGKLYKRDLKYVGKGVRQVYDYAVDHNKHTGYLVVFNLTDHILKVAGDGPTGSWPPYFEIDDVRIYVFIVRALPPETTASKRGIAHVATLTKDMTQQDV